MGSLDGHVVWITGGGTGLGRGMALEFARRGADVAVSGRRTDRLGEVAAEVAALGRGALAVACDVTSDEEVGAAVRAVVARFGRLDVAVANAGYSVRGRVLEVGLPIWRRQLEINVIGTVATLQAAFPELLKTKGRLALVGSVAGFLAAPGSAAYCASKHAVRAIGQSLSIELEGTGVTCTSLHPGYVESEIHTVANDGTVRLDAVDRRPRRLIWPTDRAARVMVDAIEKRKREVVVTGHGKFGAWMGRHFPAVVHRVMAREARRFGPLTQR